MKSDPNAIRQIIVNLIMNAIDVIDESEDILVIVGPATSITVQDSGPGFTPQAKENLFLPFFTTKTYGTGLGLAISKKLADAINCELKLDEDNEKITRFQLSFNR